MYVCVCECASTYVSLQEPSNDRLATTGTKEPAGREGKEQLLWLNLKYKHYELDLNRESVSVSRNWLIVCSKGDVMN